MGWQELVGSYGYAAVMVGTFFEGETVVLMGCLLAVSGYLQLHWVTATAFLGAFSGDLFFFYLGRTHGYDFLKKRPVWQKKSERIFYLLARHPLPTIMGLRFLYGLRAVTPFVLGMSRLSPWRYLVLGGTATLCWSVVISLVGFGLGNVLSDLLENVESAERWILIGIAVAGLLVWAIYFSRRKKPIVGHNASTRNSE